MMHDVQNRTFLFAINVGKLLGHLPYNIVNRVYFNQLARCSSSVGANFRASQRAKSQKDFLNKLKIVEEEADEAIYFLELLSALNPQHFGLFRTLINEGTEILKIVVASIRTVRNKMKNQKNPPDPL